MGTRRLEEMITDARSQAYSEDYSQTEGWNDDVVARLFNLGLNSLYHGITQIDNPANIEEYSADTTSGVQSYDIPIDVFMAIRIMDVRYYWGTQGYEFTTLTQGMIQDRLDYPLSIPTIYCIRDGKVLLSPTPNTTRADALVINYQKRMRSLDVRRGLLASKVDSPVSITLTFTSTSSKNANMQTNAEAVLDKVDYICLVDRDGAPIVTKLPVNNYDTSTQIITAETTYTFPTAELAALDAAIAAGTAIYIVGGEYSSTHSELDMQCEDYLIEFVISRLLRLQSNVGEMADARAREFEAMSSLINAYRRYRPSVYPVDFLTNNRRRMGGYGRRGVF